MASSGFVPWYNRAPRPLPAKVWLEARYPFRVPRSALACATIHATSDGVALRPFPAQVWLKAHQEGAGGFNRPPLSEHTITAR